MERPEETWGVPARTEPKREQTVWIGVAALALTTVQIPLGILSAFGVIGFAILWAVLGFLTALKFDLYFLLWSAVSLLPLSLAYLIGSVFRIPFRTRPTDAWLQVMGFFAPLAVLFLGLEMFTGTMGWESAATWTSRIALVGFALAYVSAFVAGVTGAGRSSSD